MYKSGDSGIASNYRPVSVLPAISKIFERPVYNRLLNFICLILLIGIIPYIHSTYRATLKFVDDIVCNLDNRAFTVALFVDLYKSFDTNNHSILLETYLGMQYGVWFFYKLSLCPLRK